MLRRVLASLASLALAATAGASAQTTIETSPPTVANGGLSYGVSSGSSTRWYTGQTFTVPTLDPYLQALRVTACCIDEPTPTLSLYAWSGGTLTGPSLFTGLATSSAVSPIPNNVGDFWSTDFTWTFSGLALTPGSQYVALFTDFDDLGGLVHRNADDYAGGGVVQGGMSTSNPSPPSVFTYQTANDLYFRADFGPGSVVPEPTTWVLLGTGLMVLGVAARRRGRREGSPHAS